MARTCAGSGDPAYKDGCRPRAHTRRPRTSDRAELPARHASAPHLNHPAQLPQVSLTLRLPRASMPQSKRQCVPPHQAPGGLEVGLNATTTVSSSEQIGQRINRYKLLEQLGEGGFAAASTEANRKDPSSSAQVRFDAGRKPDRRPTEAVAERRRRHQTGIAFSLASSEVDCLLAGYSNRFPCRFRGVGLISTLGGWRRGRATPIEPDRRD